MTGESSGSRGRRAGARHCGRAPAGHCASILKPLEVVSSRERASRLDEQKSSTPITALRSKSAQARRQAESGESSRADRR